MGNDHIIPSNLDDIYGSGAENADDNLFCHGSGKPGIYVGDGVLGMRYLCSVCQMEYTKPVWWGYKGSSDRNAPEHICESPCLPGLHDFSVGVQCAICGEYKDYPQQEAKG